MGMAANGFCPPSAGLQRNQWCTFSRPAAAAFFPVFRVCLTPINVCAFPGCLQVSPVLALPFYKESSLSAFFHPLSAYRS